MNGIMHEAVHSPEVQALYALCHHMPMNHDCESCRFRQQSAIAYIVNQCQGVIDSIDGRQGND